MRAVGLDLGERRIGVAVSDRAGALAVGHGVIERGDDWDAVASAIAEVVRELEAECVVVGLPLSLDGSRGPAARKAEAEAEALRALLDVPVELVDERLTTVTALRGLQAAGVRRNSRRRVVDQAAATVLLQTWLDGRRTASAALSEPEMERP